MEKIWEVLPEDTGPKKRFELAMEWIKLHPELHDQMVWLEKVEDNECGTVACLAGWVALMAGGEMHTTKYESAWGDIEDVELIINGQVCSVEETARKLLGLDLVDANDLFDPRNSIQTLEKLGKELIMDKEDDPS